MKLPVALLSLALGVFSVNAFLPLENNLAFRSPSKTISGNGLSHDVEAIGRSVLEKSRRDISGRRNRRIKYSRDEETANLIPGFDVAEGKDGRDSYKGKISFPYGVASGDPYDDSAILWTHPVPEDKDADEPICLQYQTSSKTKSWSGEDIVDEGYAWTTKDVDFSFKVETKNLDPLTQYHYRFFKCNDTSLASPEGSFKTLPEVNDENVDSLKIAVFSCSNLPFGFFNAYSQAAKSDIDLAVHVGDYIYESRGDGNAIVGSYGDGRPFDRVPLPNKEIVTLEDYRLRYASYRGKDEGLRELHRNKAWLLVWDDHEVADNSYKSGTADSNDTQAGEVDGVRFTERKRNAVKAYFEWMPIRQVDTTDSLRIWRKFQYGKLADLLMLDTRNYDRDITDIYYNTAEIAAISNDTDRSLMGGKQERWFYDSLIDANKRGSIWKIVGQQIIVNHLNNDESAFRNNYDAWDGYKANRRRMYNTIVENKIDNTIFLAGDSHAAWVFDAVYERYENDTEAYDPKTGQGALGVEFAGTAVTSPSSYGKLSKKEYQSKAESYVKTNRNLQFAEGAHRGYFDLALSQNEAVASFWGIANNNVSDSSQELLASFHVARGANRLTRPINGGKEAKSGAVQQVVVDYDKQKWNGTAFV